MMSIPHFLFSLDQDLCAIDATYVDEVFALPEITLIPDAPLGVVGVVNLRGEVLPVVVLDLDGSDRPHTYALTDSVIVLQQDSLKIGVITTAVYGIRDLDEYAIESSNPSQIGWTSSRARDMLAGVCSGEETVRVLHPPKRWFNILGIQQIVSVTSFLVDEDRGDARRTYFPTVTPEDQEVFRQRAADLRRSLTEEHANEEVQNLVVATVGDQLVGIDSQIVREFITVREAVPMPCCPPHIIGSMNLRGNVLTVVDICGALKFPVTELAEKPKAIVVEFDDVSTVIVVESIQDAMFTVSPRQLKAPLSKDGGRPGHVQSVTSYRGKKLSVLNLPTLLLSDDVVVNERV